jgi:SAM-dependent methyltransferase
MTEKYFSRDYWIQENLAYSHVYFRTEKIASIANALAKGERCDLLDIGCGPCTLATLLHKNINYFGIDIAIHDPKPYLVEADIVNNAIVWRDKSFDLIVAAGVFEYLGSLEKNKFAEINALLKPNGKFIVTYSNIQHRVKPLYPTWNNVKSIDDFKLNLEACYQVERYFPAYYSMSDRDLTNSTMRKLQLHLNCNVPFIDKLLGVNFIFVCSKKERTDTGKTPA